MTHDDTAGHEPDERDWRLERNEKADGGHATVLSPSALNRFLGCEFRTHLDILERRGALDAERRPPNMAFLFDRGERHEEQVVARLEDDGLDVVDLSMPGAKAAERAAATVDALRNGHDVIYHHTYVSPGDRCLMEGISQEALALAGKQQLSRLTLLWDNNGITIDGKVSLSDITDQKARFAASGWDVFDCDGHDPVDIDRAITAAKASPRPAMIACKTHIALGSSAQDTSKGHGALTDPKLMADTKAAYGWTAAPFEIPAKIKAAGYIPMLMAIEWFNDLSLIHISEPTRPY